MKILIADKLPEVARERLEHAGGTVIANPSLKGAALEAELAATQPDVLVVRSTRVEKAHFEAAPSLQLVVRAGAGVNTIDFSTASARAVSVANCPGMNAVAVAELTFAHILNADRRIADNVADLRQGRWRKKHFVKARGIKDRTLGVLGCGAIGRAVIKRAQAFELKVAAYSPRLDDDLARELGVERCATALELAGRCSILTVHVPLTDATRNLVSDEMFDALPEGAIVVNTSRGGIIDEEALARAVAAKGIRAGLDVFCDEPSADGDWRSSIVDLEGVYGTHHIGASTDQAQDAVAEEVCRIILTWWATGEVSNCVNLAKGNSATHQLVVRHLDRVGVLANLLGLLREAKINVQGMSNQIYSGEHGAACAKIQVEGDVDEALLERMAAGPDVLNITTVTLD